MASDSSRETVTVEAEIEPYELEYLREWADATGTDVESVAGAALSEQLEEWC